METSRLTRRRAPTSGGQYHWVFMLAPVRIRKFTSYIIGNTAHFPGRMEGTNCTRLAGHSCMARASCWSLIPWREPDRSIDCNERPYLYSTAMAWNVATVGIYYQWRYAERLCDSSNTKA